MRWPFFVFGTGGTGGLDRITKVPELGFKKVDIHESFNSSKLLSRLGADSLMLRYVLGVQAHHIDSKMASYVDCAFVMELLGNNDQGNADQKFVGREPQSLRFVGQHSHTQCDLQGRIEGSELPSSNRVRCSFDFCCRR